jgi:hypothetical protein
MRSGDNLTGAARFAAVVAPWTVVPIIALALKGGPHLSRLELFGSGILMGLLFGVPLAYLGVLLVGYPAYKLLLAHDYLNAWSLCSVGATAGALGGLIIVGIEAVPLCALCGVAVAFVAWLMIRGAILHNSTEQGHLLPGPNKRLERP